MERGEVPPNWEDLCRNSYESAEDESVADAIKYLTSQIGPVQDTTTESAHPLGAPSEAAVRAATEDPLSDPFAVSFDRQLSSNMNPSSTNSPYRSASEGDDPPR